MECYTAGLSRKKKHRTKNSSALRDLIEYSIKKIKFLLILRNVFWEYHYKKENKGFQNNVLE